MERLTEYAYGTAQLKKLAAEHAYESCHDCCDNCVEECEQDSCAKCPINEAFIQLSAYEDTGLTPEEINKIVSGAPVKVSFDIGDKGFLTAINGAFKERFGITADECSKTISDLQAERDTLKKALELACNAFDYTPGGHTLMDLYIQQAQEQEGKK